MKNRALTIIALLALCFNTASVTFGADPSPGFPPEISCEGGVARTLRSKLSNLFLKEMKAKPIKWHEVAFNPSLPLTLRRRLTRNPRQYRFWVRAAVGAPLFFFVYTPYLYGPVGAFTDQEIEKHFINNAATAEKIKNRDFPGQTYIESMVNAGLLGTGAVYDLATPKAKLIFPLNKQWDSLIAWEAANRSRNSTHAAYLDRVLEYRDLGILPDPKQTDALNAKALEVFRQAIIDKATDPKIQLEPHLDELWSEALQTPPWSGLDGDRRTLLKMIFWPSVEIDDGSWPVSKSRSDMELLARSLGVKSEKTGAQDSLAALKPFFSTKKIPEILAMASEMAGSPKKIESGYEQKRADWLKTFPGEPVPFGKRPDLLETRNWSKTPAEFDQLGTGNGTLKLSSEGDLWKLIWKDPRFQPIQKAYLAKDLNEAEVLDKALDQVETLNQFYTFASMSEKPEQELKCLWLESNPMIRESIDGYMEKTLSPQLKVSEKAVQGCRIELTDVIFDAYLADLRFYQAHPALLSGAAPATKEEALKQKAEHEQMIAPTLKNAQSILINCITSTHPKSCPNRSR